MKNVILLHGQPDKEEYYDPSEPSASNAHWFPWLQKQLLVSGKQAQTPEVPECYELNWNVWKKEVERFELNQDTVLVGHSTGGGFWIRYLSEHPQIKVGKLILVAPWNDPFNEFGTDFFKYEIDADLAQRTGSIVILASKDDDKSIIATVEQLQNTINNVEVIWYEDKGHFTERSLGSKEFPELLKEILR